MSDLRKVESADVYKGDRIAGTLTRSGAEVAFNYSDEYLADGAIALATSLPLKSEAVVTVGGAIPPYFAGLLPEGRRLTALRQRLKTSLDDELTLVLAIGADPIGDVRIIPTDHQPVIPEPTFYWQQGAAFDFREVLESSNISERRGIAGLQDKTSAAMITLPAKGSGRDAIVKLSPPEYPFLVENEAWFLGLAHRTGLSVPKFRVITDSFGINGLLVERFDRDYAGEQVVRHAVEDGTQVLGIYPADKYRVTAESVSQALISQCASRKFAALQIFQYFLFAWLTGNGDMHAKNLSILNASISGQEREWRISPFYDLPSTLPYGDTTMALDLSGRNLDLSFKSFLQFADSIELPEAAARRCINEMLLATEPVVHLFQANEEPFANSRNSESRQQIVHRRRLLHIK